MAEKRWITGEEILERWQALDFELANAYVGGGNACIGQSIQIEPYIDGKKPNKKCMLCLYGDDEGSPAGRYVGETEKQNFNCSPESDETCFHSDISLNSLAMKLKEHNFLLSEVEAYEQAHGLGPLPHKPETAEALAETLRAAGITDAGMIARMVKAAFPDTRQVDIGLLLADGDDKKKKTLGASIKRAQRAKEKKDAPAPAKRSRTAKAK